MDQTEPNSEEHPSKVGILEGETQSQEPTNESGSDGKKTGDEAVGVTDAAQQPVEPVGPTMRRVPLSPNYVSSPRRDNAYNFIWGEDVNTYNFLSGEDIKGPVAGGSKSGMEASPPQKAAQSLFGEKAGSPLEQDTTTVFDAHPPIVTQDMRILFAQQQREIRNSIGKQQNEKVIPMARATAKVVEKPETGRSAALDVRESILDRREREFDRRDREIDRRERDLERRERELERRQREFENDKGRWGSSHVQNTPHWKEAIESFKHQIKADLLAEQKKAIEREALFEQKIIKKVNKVLEHERQLYGVMRMSDNEVNEMVESSVGYLLHTDEDIADRVRFQSLLYLTQERLASEARLQPPAGSDSFSLSWRLALGPSVVTEDRYKKALELLKDKDLNESTKKVVESKTAMEYAVEYTSHLRKEGTETSDHSFSFGRISRKDYMESVERHSSQNPVEYEALKILVDFVSPEV